MTRDCLMPDCLGCPGRSDQRLRPAAPGRRRGARRSSSMAGRGLRKGVRRPRTCTHLCSVASNGHTRRYEVPGQSAERLLFLKPSGRLRSPGKAASVNESGVRRWPAGREPRAKCGVAATVRRGRLPQVWGSPALVDAVNAASTSLDGTKVFRRSCRGRPLAARPPSLHAALRANARTADHHRKARTD